MQRARLVKALAGLRRPRIVAAAVAVTATACSSTLPQSSLNPRSSEAQAIDGLWSLVFAIAVVIFILVEAALVVAMIRFRDRPGREEPKQVHGNTPLEITWTIIPAVILAIVAVPTLRTLFDLRSPATGADVVRVRVVGHQWWWEFEYPDITDAEGRPLRTANELYVPAGRTTELEMTSADVIHSFWAPGLSGKRDLVPGATTYLKITPNADTVGEVFPGQCAEFCWIGHADMRFRIFVLDEPGFEAWAAAQVEPVDVPTAGPAAAGYETFVNTCTACHSAYVRTPDGSVEEIGNPLAPDLTHFGSRSTLGAAILENTPEHLGRWIDDPSSVKAMAPELNRIAEGRILGMPDYDLSPQEIADLVALLEAWK